MKAPSLEPAGPKGPAMSPRLPPGIPKAPANLVPKPKMSKPRLKTIKNMLMRSGGKPGMPPFGGK